MNNSTNKKIIKLYQSGLSVKQISDLFGVSVSKIRYLMRKQLIPMRDHRSASRMLHVTKFGKRQCNIKSNLSNEEKYLRVAGVMLYWGEGTKSGNSVVFSNSDPDMVSLFLRFLRQICGIDEKRLRILLHLYSDHNENRLKHFWSEIANIPIDQFSKTFIHQKRKGTYKKISRFGTVSLRYSDKELLTIINDWINKYKTANVAQR